jgi:hypothetical protein
VVWHPYGNRGVGGDADYPYPGSHNFGVQLICCIGRLDGVLGRLCKRVKCPISARQNAGLKSGDNHESKGKDSDPPFGAREMAADALKVFAPALLWLFAAAMVIGGYLGISFSNGDIGAGVLGVVLILLGGDSL